MSPARGPGGGAGELGSGPDNSQVPGRRDRRCPGIFRFQCHLGALSFPAPSGRLPFRSAVTKPCLVELQPTARPPDGRLAALSSSPIAPPLAPPPPCDPPPASPSPFTATARDGMDLQGTASSIGTSTMFT